MFSAWPESEVPHADRLSWLEAPWAWTAPPTFTTVLSCDLPPTLVTPATVTTLLWSDLPPTTVAPATFTTLLSWVFGPVTATPSMETTLLWLPFATAVEPTGDRPVLTARALLWLPTWPELANAPVPGFWSPTPTASPPLPENEM